MRTGQPIRVHFVPTVSAIPDEPEEGIFVRTNRQTLTYGCEQDGRLRFRTLSVSRISRIEQITE